MDGGARGRVQARRPRARARNAILGWPLLRVRAARLLGGRLPLAAAAARAAAASRGRCQVGRQGRRAGSGSGRAAALSAPDGARTGRGPARVRGLPFCSRAGATLPRCGALMASLRASLLGRRRLEATPDGAALGERARGQGRRCRDEHERDPRVAPSGRADRLGRLGRLGADRHRPRRRLGGALGYQCALGPVRAAAARRRGHAARAPRRAAVHLVCGRLHAPRVRCVGRPGDRAGQAHVS